MKLLSLHKNSPAATTTSTMTTIVAQSSSWMWQAYCHQPKTLSFRGSNDIFRTVNSTFIKGLDSPPEPPEEEVDGYDNREDDCVETVIRGARSEGRLFFEPAGETSSVLAVESEDAELGDGVAMCVVESMDPHGDFRMSMEEMVEAHALRGKWHSLEELLRCYLRVNDPTNHAYILRAFIDLLLSSNFQRTRASADDSSCSYNCDNTNNGSGEVNINPPCTSSPCWPLSSYTSSSSCCFSSSDSLSTMPCCISVTGEAEENSRSSSVGMGQPQCLP